MVLGTADICDRYADLIQVADPGLHNFGGIKRISAPIETLKIYRDNTRFWEFLSEPGQERILVVDAGGDLSAVMGDKMATIAAESGWKGMLINGYVRDTEVLAQLPLAVWALGAYPMKKAFQARAQSSVSLDFHSVHWTPGDQLYADADGILLASSALPGFDPF
ncbi:MULTISPECIES: ribonuclease E activity regulator RraA [Thiomicrorhabdus]|uniref:4-hydroxy-4-methyl-2-oxoglutarate aldolase n=1 Tax=Thiomicrorhabdus heinhorstiae TaxID=2748010 RepID=A0ABS0BZM8_9GAMM|nr:MULTISPECIES: ribonuclease E activity regulator RraA [Thiomicrorhabdus]MBF6058505.1 ribonuclease E activity regulator RraA [Thiomicrorhabdus heinhorstiae]